MIVSNYNFICKNKDCPESYDIFSFITGKVVAEVEVRFGVLRCRLTNNNGIIYNYNFNNEYKGCFDTEEELLKYMKDIATVLDGYVRCY